jgi:hypothetical protein
MMMGGLLGAMPAERERAIRRLTRRVLIGNLVRLSLLLHLYPQNLPFVHPYTPVDLIELIC